MATLINGLRGDTLRVIEALQRIQDDPEALAQQQRRYNDSPPPYPSGETTRPPSPVPPLSAADRRIQRQHDRLQSVPYWQYMNQWRREEDRIIEQIERRRERRKETLPYNRKLDLVTNAKNNIKNTWIEQGIWNEKWTGYPSGRWKHEEPLEDQTEAQHEQSPQFLGVFRSASDHRRPPPKISEEQRAVREREAAASRPLPQFRYQISKERKWLEDEFWHEQVTGLVDVDATAYENVKKSWIEQKIWNPKWARNLEWRGCMKSRTKTSLTSPLPLRLLLQTNAMPLIMWNKPSVPPLDRLFSVSDPLTMATAMATDLAAMLRSLPESATSHPNPTSTRNP